MKPACDRPGQAVTRTDSERGWGKKGGRARTDRAAALPLLIRQAYNKLGPEGARVLAPALGRMRDLRVLWLVSCGLGCCCCEGCRIGRCCGEI